MKRCNLCGYENPITRTNCEKCGSQLSIQYESTDPASTRKGEIPTAPPLDNDITNFNHAGASELENKSMINCSNCGYLMRPGEKLCPKCGHTTQIKDNRTRDIYREPRKASCSLIKIPRDNEKKEELIELLGNVLNLNRQLLDPSNDTISKNEHAVLEFKEGVWFISNKSSTQNTFIQVQSPTPLKDGDIILLGDRKFKFKID